MTIFFGVDAVSGVARYEYDIENDGGSTVTGNGGVIHVHQYNYPKA
jgi:putative cofactor-binding repeat protein